MKAQLQLLFDIVNVLAVDRMVGLQLDQTFQMPFPPDQAPPQQSLRQDDDGGDDDDDYFADLAAL